MPTYDQNNASCHVFTFKEGLLSKIAHDLQIAVTRFEIDVDALSQQVRAWFDASSLRVITAMKSGAPSPGALSDGDKAKIAAHIRDDVLHSAKYPRIEFSSQRVVERPGGGYDLEGALSLHGVTKPIIAHTKLERGRQVLELTLHQPEFGIVPFRAMMGALKIQPDVKIRVTA